MSKSRRKTIDTNFEEIMPHLVSSWRKFHKIKGGGPADHLHTGEFRGVVTAIDKLNEAFTNHTSFLKKDYFEDRKLLGAYLLYYFPLHYAEGLSLLSELPDPPLRVLDLCAGPAAFSLAALRLGASEVYAVDRNETALHLGAEICGKLGHTLTIRKWDYKKDDLPVEGLFDCIILGHCLLEIFPSIDAMYTFIKSLFNRLTVDGHILIVEDSWKTGNECTLRLRDKLVQDKIVVQAPCIWQGACPALQNKTFCFAQRPLEKPFLISEIQRAANINLGSLKMSYLLVKHPDAKQTQLPEYPIYRVVSPPIQSLRGKRFYLCGTDGYKTLGSRLNENPPESRAFEFMQRGEVISIHDGLIKNESIEIIEGTSVKIESALAKPLPFFQRQELDKSEE